jgi:hypothetical protein
LFVSLRLTRKFPDKHHTAITSVNQEQSYNLNSLTIQQPVNTLLEVPFNSKDGPLEYNSVLDTSTDVLGSPLFQAHDHGPVHTLEEQCFDTIVGYLKYTGTLDPETLTLSVNIYAKSPILPEIPLGYAEGNLADGVTVQFDKSGVGARGSVEFYKRDGDWKEMWARSKYTFLGQEYKSDFPVLRIQQDDTAPISLQAQSHGLIHIQGEVPFSKIVGPLQYTGTVDTITFGINVDVYLASSNTLLGHVDGNLKDGARLYLNKEGVTGDVIFYVREGRAVWVLSRIKFNGEAFDENLKVLDVSQWVRQASRIHPMDSSSSFDVTSGPTSIHRHCRFQHARPQR